MSNDVGSADVAIVGGGMVGASLALLLAQRARVAPERVVVIEPESVQAPQTDAAYDLRVTAISPGNRRLLSDLGVWQRMDRTRVVNYQRMVVWQEAIPPDSPDVLRFDAAQLGEADLGSIVENRNLQAALQAACGAEGIQVRRARLAGLECDVDQARVILDAGEVHAELVVGADGAHSSVRRLSGIPHEGRDYQQQGIVATLRSEHGHRDTAWQRFLHTGPLALLPLASGECSIVWSVTSARAQELLDMDDDQFGAAVSAASAGVLGRLAPVSARVAFPLRRQAARRYAGMRCVLVGDAAHVIHPLAGQGVNEGLQDALALAEALAQRPRRESVGAARALDRYARQRRSGNALMGAMVDGLNTLFTGSPPALAALATAGMGIAGHSRMLQRLLFRRAAMHGANRPKV